ncbi:Col_cuticle_N domain-containing protein [Meloidogyne graminicola]|uniref:Col_cuticle_N domain-containing protein n=1 Tax=Meloidogyne graminicola TaxID=189291 RepID=A0A8S9ZHV2_9BILA|nr:Col_cuticle_N domain-containing protein [Meloidogyne graminicola]
MKNKDIINQQKLYEKRKCYADKLKKITFISVTFGTVACIFSILIIPLLYIYTQHIQLILEPKLKICRTESRRLRVELIETEELLIITKQKTRIQRQTIHSSSTKIKKQQKSSLKLFASQPSISPFPLEEIISSCCRCGIGEPGLPGQPGNPGAPGPDGRNGAEGIPGVDGIPGIPLSEQEWCFDCPQAPPGSRGPPGPKGPNGQIGLPGTPGTPGNKGQPGIIGEPGFKGLPGPRGNRGPNGMPGKLIEHPGPRGAQGRTGAYGPSGASRPSWPSRKARTTWTYRREGL